MPNANYSLVVAERKIAFFDFLRIGQLKLANDSFMHAFCFLSNRTNVIWKA